MKKIGRSFKSTGAVLVIAALTMGMGGCFSVSPSTATIDVGESVQLSVTGLFGLSAYSQYSWSSASEGLATVDQTGLVTGVGPGQVVITVTGSNPAKGTVNTASATIVVRQGSGPRVTVTPANSTLNIGQMVQLSASSTDALDTSFTWGSSNSGVASVNASGKVTANAAGGPVTITATGSNSGRSGTARVTVNPAPLVTVTVTPGNSTLNIGQMVQLSASSTDALDTSFTWGSSNSGVASVDTNGKVTANAAGGPVTITATGSNSGQSGTSSVTVNPPTPVTVTVTPPSSTLDIGQMMQLAASSTDALDTSFTWGSNNSGVASVDTNGKVTANAAGGPVTITATGSNSGQGGTASVTVNAFVPADVNAQAVVTPPTGEDDAFWDTLTPTIVNTSGNPDNGGHGRTGTNQPVKAVTTPTPVVSIKAAYDANNLYMRLQWDDPTEDSSGRKWTFDGSAWSKAGNEDRLYVMWPVVDGAGRQGMTFSEIGCAMTCHQRDAIDGNQIVPNIDPLVPVENCNVCHEAPGNRVGETPPFEHRRFLFDGVTEIMACNLCHSGTYQTVKAGGGDMFAPAGTAYDVWHWKAQRSNPLNVAEDQFTANGRRRARDLTNLAPDNTRSDLAGPKYIWADGTPGETPIFQLMIDASSNRLAGWDGANYLNLSTMAVVTPANGQTASRHILRDDLVNLVNPNLGDPSATILAHGSHDPVTDTWAVMLTRPLLSADPQRETPVTSGQFFDTDIDFDVFQTYLFSIATTNNTGTNHHGVAGPLSLAFQP